MTYEKGQMVIRHRIEQRKCLDNNKCCSFSLSLSLSFSLPYSLIAMFIIHIYAHNLVDPLSRICPYHLLSLLPFHLCFTNTIYIYKKQHLYYFFFILVLLEMKTNSTLQYRVYEIRSSKYQNVL